MFGIFDPEHNLYILDEVIMENAKTAKILIRTSQRDRDGSTDIMEFFTEGKYYEKGGARYVMYKETEVSGMEGTASTLKLAEEEVTLVRSGNVHARFVFVKGQEAHTAYQTGYGIIHMKLNTKDVQVQDTGEASFTVFLDYELQLEGQDALLNEMEIKVTLGR